MLLLQSMTVEQILLSAFLLINVSTFVITANDKRKSRYGNGANRTPEGLIFFLATMLGAVGVYAAMLLFRHKTRKWYFQLGIPLLILQNLAIVYLIRGLVV